MKFPHRVKLLVFLGILVAFGLVILVILWIFAIGGTPEKIDIHESEKSSEGIALENFLPQNTMITYSLNLQDKSQKEKFDKLKSHFPSDDFEYLIEMIIEEISSEFDQYNLSYKEDVASIFSDKFRILIGMGGSYEEDIKSEKDNTDDNPKIYIAATIADTQKAMDLINKLAETDDFEKGDSYGYATLEGDDLYLVLYHDTALIAFQKEFLNSAVKRMENNEKSLLSNKQFINSYKKLQKPNLGNIFIDLQQLVEISKISDTQKDETNSSGSAKNNEYESKDSSDGGKSHSEINDLSEDLFNSISAETLAMIAEETGIKIMVDVVFNPESENFNFADLPYEKPYMHKKIPGERLMVYAEASELKRMYELRSLLMGTKEGPQEAGPVKFNKKISKLKPSLLQCLLNRFRQ